MREEIEEIYKKHYNKILHLCNKILRNMSDAEDVTQEVFISVARHLASFRGEADFSSWLYRIAVNHCRMFFRQTIHKHEFTVYDSNFEVSTIYKKRTSPSYDTGPDRWMPPDRSYKSLDLRMDIEDALALVAPGMRRMMMLHDYEGYEHEEIGVIVGKSAGTSKSQTNKARKVLKKLLNRRVGDSLPVRTRRKKEK